MKNVWTLLCWRLNVLIMAYNTFKKQKLAQWALETGLEKSERFLSST